MIEEMRVLQKAEELGNSVEAVTREIKRVASVKCRLNKMPGRSDYALKMANVTEEEELLKAVRDLLKGEPNNTSTLTEERIASMEYDEVIRAIRSIQSKKTHTKYADDCLRDEEGLFIPGSGESYKEACRIEDMLKARREELKPSVSRFSRAALLEYMETLDCDYTKDFETKYELLREFITNGEVAQEV